MRRPRVVQVLGSVISGFAMSLGRWSWAQVPGTSPGAPLPGDGTALGPGVMGFGLFLAFIVLLAVLAKIYDLRKKREAEAVAIQSEISEALMADPALGRLPVAVTVRIPLASPQALLGEVRGQVPSQTAHDMVLRVVKRELQQHSAASQVEDGLAVIPRAA